MQNWSSLKKELLKNKKVKAEYDRLMPKYRFVSQLIGARLEKSLTQKQLAKKIGTKQSAIARIEGGYANPSIAFLEKMTAALGRDLIIQIK